MELVQALRARMVRLTKHPYHTRYLVQKLTCRKAPIIASIDVTVQTELVLSLSWHTVSIYASR